MKKDNYLDYIPMLLPEWKVCEEEDGTLDILVENRGFYNRLAQILWKRPRESRIHLDDRGSFILACMDGKRTIYEIGRLFLAAYGKQAEPLYERLTEFIRILYRQGLVVYVRS